MYSKLQYISQGKTGAEQLLNIKEVLEGGCKWIQLRVKDQFVLKSIVKEVKLLCDQYNATLIINDFIEVAKEIDASGVHLGLGDDSIAKAREILGENKIIGGSTNTLQDVIKRIEEKSDYIGLGPYSYTQTKDNISSILGVEGYQFILNTVKGNKIPIYAIGGIKLENVKELMQTNVYGIAISGSITSALNKKEYIKSLKQLLNE